MPFSYPTLFRDDPGGTRIDTRGRGKWTIDPTLAAFGLQVLSYDSRMFPC